MSADRKTAVELLENEQYNSAMLAFTQLVENTPEDWSLHYMLGRCYLQMSNVPRAIEMLTNAIELNPNQAEINLALGDALQIDGQHEQAIEYFERATKIEPGLIDAYCSVGHTYKILGHYRLAMKWYLDAAECLFQAVYTKVHKNPNLYFKDEVINGQKKRIPTRYPYAIKAFLEITKSTLTYSEIKNNLGICLMALDDEKGAREQFEEAIKFIPEDMDFLEPFDNLAKLDSKVS